MLCLAGKYESAADTSQLYIEEISHASSFQPIINKQNKKQKIKWQKL